MKDAYARAGIIMQPDPLDWSVMMERLQKKNFDAVTLGWTAGIETDIFQMFDSSQAMADGDNAGSYKNPELDKVIDQARQTLDETKRMKLWRDAHRIISEDQPYTFLFFPKSLIFMDARIKNVQTVKLGLNPRTEWFVPKAQQRTAEISRHAELYYSPTAADDPDTDRHHHDGVFHHGLVARQGQHGAALGRGKYAA